MRSTPGANALKFLEFIYLLFLQDTLFCYYTHKKLFNNCLNSNNYAYLETSGGYNSNLYLNVVHFFNTSIN